MAHFPIFLTPGSKAAISFPFCVRSSNSQTCAKPKYDFINTLDGLSFVQRTTLYLPDPTDPSAMWGYTAWREYRNEDGFARFYVVKDFEKAMAAALEGNDDDLDRINDLKAFMRYRLLLDGQKAPVGILRIDGNPRENFREYRLGS